MSSKRSRLSAEQELHRLAEQRRVLTERTVLAGSPELLDFDCKLTEVSHRLREPDPRSVVGALDDASQALDRLASRSAILARLADLRTRRATELLDLPLGKLAELPVVRSVDLALARAETQLENGRHARARASLTLAGQMLELWRQPPREGLEPLGRRISQWARRDPITAEALQRFLQAGASGLAARLLDELAIRAGTPARRHSSEVSEGDESLRRAAETTARRVQGWLATVRRNHGSS